MKALNQYPGYVAQSLSSGADAIVVGAGLPLDLPELAKDFPNTALIPILSDARGVQLVVRKWEKKGRLPSAIVIEHPKLAGGHLGASSIDDINDPRFNFEVAIPASLSFLKQQGWKGKFRSSLRVAFHAVKTSLNYRRWAHLLCNWVPHLR
jgi:nitronate monooxygenase